MDELNDGLEFFFEKVDSRKMSGDGSDLEEKNAKDALFTESTKSAEVAWWKLKTLKCMENCFIGRFIGLKLLYWRGHICSKSAEFNSFTNLMNIITKIEVVLKLLGIPSSQEYGKFSSCTGVQLEIIGPREA